MTRPTHDELHLSEAARQMGMMSGEYPAQGVDPKSTCIPAYTLNEHDSSPNAAFVYGGGHAHLSTGGRNTLLIAALSVCAALLLGIGYLLTVDWSDFLAGLRNLSSW